jgi:hypothetical protein
MVQFVTSPLLAALGWAATSIMAAAVIAILPS